MFTERPRIPLRQMALVGFLPSSIKKLIYRMKGYKIGKNVKIGMGTVIDAQEVEIADHVTIGFLAVIRVKHLKLGRYVSVGALTFMDTERVEIGEDTRIREQVYVGGITDSQSCLKVGKRCTIMQHSFVNPTRPIIIGDDSGVGGDCLIFTHGSWLSQLDGYPVKFAPVTIGNNVWLPWRVFVMPGVTIGNGVVISSGSVIASDLPGRSLAMGSPARVVVEGFPKRLSPKDRERHLRQMVSDFVGHMQDNSISVEQKTSDPTKEVIYCQSEKKTHEIDILFHKNGPVAPKHRDNVLVLDYDEPEAEQLSENYEMVLNLATRSRRGSSDVGEAFTSYLSRFGVRFDRLD